MKFGVVVFPGSNCDHDAYHVVKRVAHQPVEFLWHKDTDLKGSDVVILPGGFSYGDYLRCGAIARFSPIMESIRRHADRGGLVLGICNGFQILTEAGLLPGVLLRNRGLKFICDFVHLKVEKASTPFSQMYKEGEVLRLPIAHNDGNYFADPETLLALEKKQQIVFRYCSPQGQVDDHHNPNGAARGIAGIVNEAGNVLGMMPHPERASEKELGSDDGLRLFQSLVAQMAGR